MALRFVAGLAAGALLAGGGLYLWRSAAWSDAERRMAPRMHSFVRALTEPPRNADPAPGWKPLVREPVSCALCHGAEGARMEEDIERGILDVDAPAPPLAHDEMVALMERWVRELNRKAGLGRAVVCLDCHRVDPRRR